MGFFKGWSSWNIHYHLCSSGTVQRQCGVSSKKKIYFITCSPYSLLHLDLALCIRSSFSFQIQHYCFEVMKPDVSATILKKFQNTERCFSLVISCLKVHFRSKTLLFHEGNSWMLHMTMCTKQKAYIWNCRKEISEFCGEEPGFVNYSATACVIHAKVDKLTEDSATDTVSL